MDTENERKGGIPVPVTPGDRVKAFVSSKMLERIVNAATSDDEGSLADIFELMSKLAPARYYRESFGDLSKMVREDHPFSRVFRRLFTDLNPNCRQKAITNFFVNFLVLGRGIRDRKEIELGLHLPNFLVISPTMRCNLRCKGCYAGDYAKEEELSFAELDRIISEARELGMYFFTFSGGECFFRPDLLDLWEKNDDCFFHVYTNGTLLDERMVDRLAELGNVAPMLSVEGTREETDGRRGPGVYDKVMESFSRLNNRGILFGFSATYTRSSASYLASDDFMEEMIGMGCKVGWFFQYIPTGNEPDLGYMASSCTERSHSGEKHTRYSWGISGMTAHTLTGAWRREKDTSTSFPTVMSSPVCSRTLQSITSGTRALSM